MEVVTRHITMLSPQVAKYMCSLTTRVKEVR